jgi:hypothetical protein
MASSLRTSIAGFLDVVLTTQPVRTCVGATAGAVGLAVSSFFEHRDGFARLASAVDLQAWHWVALGIVMAHVPTLIAHFTAPTRIDRNLASALGIIESGVFSESERQLRYRKLIAAVYASVTDRERMKSAVDAVVSSKDKTKER